MKRVYVFFFFFSSRRRHTRWTGDWSSDVCSSDLVSEWCLDWYDKNYYSQSAGADPKGPGNGLERVKRGGSHFDDSSKVRCSSREGAAPNEILDTDGFRIVAAAHAQ